jgi:hypothetical protein
VVEIAKAWPLEIFNPPESDLSFDFESTDILFVEALDVQGFESRGKFRNPQ